mgnify:CR=1 FL=1
MAGACDENSWNDHLDGFEEFEDEPFTQVETVEYTLTNADYATIASLAANQALAGQDGAASLKAVGDLKRFSDAAPADKYVPAFLGSTGFPYFTLNDGSAVNLTYKQPTSRPVSPLPLLPRQLLLATSSIRTRFGTARTISSASDRCKMPPTIYLTSSRV